MGVGLIKNKLTLWIITVKNIEKKIPLELNLARSFPKIVAIIILLLSVKKFQHYTSSLVPPVIKRHTINLRWPCERRWEEVDDPIRAKSPSHSKEEIVAMSCHETIIILYFPRPLGSTPPAYDDPIRAKSPSHLKEKTVAKSWYETIQVWQITKRDFGVYERDKKKRFSLWGANNLEPCLLSLVKIFALTWIISTLVACPFLNLR